MHVFYHPHHARRKSWGQVSLQTYESLYVFEIQHGRVTHFRHIELSLVVAQAEKLFLHGIQDLFPGFRKFSGFFHTFELLAGQSHFIYRLFELASLFTWYKRFALTYRCDNFSFAHNALSRLNNVWSLLKLFYFDKSVIFFNIWIISIFSFQCSTFLLECLTLKFFVIFVFNSI